MTPTPQSQSVEEIVDEFTKKFTYAGNGYYLDDTVDACTAIDWLRDKLHSYPQLVVDKIEELRRTDENHLSHDHTYDEAIDDVLAIIKSNHP